VWTEEADHVGDIVQTFFLEDLREIPFFAIPAWIRHQLFGRATVGRIKPNIPNHDPYNVLSKIYESGDRPIDVSPTDNPEIVAERLLNFVTPAIFEMLICELLLLDRPGEYWWHVGGSGDGGVDALGFSKDGSIVGAAQCKLAALSQDELLMLGKEMVSHFSAAHRTAIFVCSLYSTLDSIEQGGVTVFGRSAIVRLLLKHKNRSTFGAMIGLRTH